MKNKLRIVFMGTPEFAVGILDAVINAGYEVAAVVTAADKPAGRGQKLKNSAVKEYALAHNLKILQPINLKSPEFLDDLKSINANLQIVVAFRMLPEAVWRMPELGTFNLHASLLPQYRGAAPINWAIINGETKTGVTTFFIDEKIDTGAIIHNIETDILPDENAGQLHDRLRDIGSRAVLDTLQMIEQDTVTLKIQSESENLKTAYKLNRENCRIDWSRSSHEIYDLIRGLSPYPGAWTNIRDNDQEWDVKVYSADIIEAAHSLENGQITIEDKEMMVATKDGFLKLGLLQFPGKRAMNVRDLLNGLTLSPDSRAV